MKIDLVKEIELPQGITAQLAEAVLKIKGPKGEAERKFLHPKIAVLIGGAKIILSSPKATKRERTIIGSFVAHITNMINGVQEPHIYKLKICSGHFPMNVSVSGEELLIKNFLGESVPRKVKIIKGADVKVNGDEIVINGIDKEVAGQMAARIESICRITNRDIRIFQDGCYMTHKGGKDLV